MKYFYIIVSFFLLPFYSSAQDSLKHSSNLREGNRWEGTPDMPVGATMQLAGIHRQMPSTYAAGDNLTVHFYQPLNTGTEISARHKDPNANNYRMEVQQRNWGTGWQAFAPWHVSEVLVPSHVTANNLGVLIKTVTGLYLPASVVKNGEQFTKVNRYRFYIWPPAYIPLLTYKVLDAEEKVVIEKTKEEIQAKIVISLLVDMEGLPTGNYKLMLQSGSVVLGSYSFYHAKL